MSRPLSTLALPALLLALATSTSCGGSGGNAGPSGAAGGSGAGGRGGAAGGGGAAGAAAGAGGTAGVAGTEGGSGGTTGGSGAGGRSGAAGGIAGAAGGTAGAAGGTAGAAGGTAGAAGAAGVAGTAGAAGGAAGTGGATLPANVTVESMTSSTTTTSFSARLTNMGPTTPLISAIKMRYYFLDDSTNRNATPLIASASWKIASPSTTINLASTGGCTALTTYATAPQNSYVDFGCALTSPMAAADTITIAMTIDPATQIPTNDYSYLPPVSVSQFVANVNMLAIVNGVVVAGTPPP